MLSSKKLDFAAGIYLSEVQNPIPSPLTHCICVIVYQILIHTGKGERGHWKKPRDILIQAILIQDYNIGNEKLNGDETTQAILITREVIDLGYSVLASSWTRDTVKSEEQQFTKLGPFTDKFVWMTIFSFGVYIVN